MNNTVKSSKLMFFMSLFIIILFATFAFSYTTLSDETQTKFYLKLFSNIVFTILTVNTFNRLSQNPNYNFNQTKINKFAKLVFGVMFCLFFGLFVYKPNIIQNSSLHNWMKNILSRVSMFLFICIGIWQVFVPFTELIFKTKRHGSKGIALVYLLAIASIILVKVDKSLINDKTTLLQEVGLITSIFMLCIMTYVTLNDKSNINDYYNII